ncbi:hypothetical protein OCU04_011978 [Sclerotinia nivalis]|uniref:Uncharacterized protein n=1 Tax=Sclerotinia nivalis TaxID=352851 RepID=A0A9X0DD31_9HELO|nr:hypothetical protein OCU04_011978 [Sclerotinia nivalis]
MCSGAGLPSIFLLFKRSRQNKRDADIIYADERPKVIAVGVRMALIPHLVHQLIQNSTIEGRKSRLDRYDHNCTAPTRHHHIFHGIRSHHLLPSEKPLCVPSTSAVFEIYSEALQTAQEGKQDFDMETGSSCAGHKTIFLN